VLKFTQALKAEGKNVAGAAAKDSLSVKLKGQA